MRSIRGTSPHEGTIRMLQDFARESHGRLGSLRDELTALQDRVAALESATGLSDRVEALEQAPDLQKRVKALEHPKTSTRVVTKRK